MIKLLCEETAKQGINVNLTSVFTFIGMAFSIVVSLVALVWLTCFVVRLLIKTFKIQVQNSYDVYVENSTAKANSKKERNAIKRQAKDARKLEILNMKEESRNRIHELKVNKLGLKLLKNEEKAKEKYVVNEPSDKELENSKQTKKQDALKKNENERVEKQKKENSNAWGGRQWCWSIIWW